MKMKGPMQGDEENILLYSHQLRAPLCSLHCWKAVTYGPETLILFIFISFGQFLLSLVSLGRLLPRHDWNQQGFAGPSCQYPWVFPFSALFPPSSEAVPLPTAQQVWPPDPGPQGSQ